MVEGNKDELLVYKIFLQKELTLHFRPRQIGAPRVSKAQSRVWDLLFLDSHKARKEDNK